MGSADTRISVRNPSSVSWQVHGGRQPGKAVAMVLETSSHERSPFSHASCGGRWHFLPLSDAVRAMHRMLGTGVQGSNGGCYSAAISLISSMLSNHRMSRSAAVENNIRRRTHVGSLMADDRARSRRATTLNAKSTPNFLNSSGVSGSGRRARSFSAGARHSAMLYLRASKSRARQSSPFRYFRAQLRTDGISHLVARSRTATQEVVHSRICRLMFPTALRAR